LDLGAVLLVLACSGLCTLQAVWVQVIDPRLTVWFTGALAVVPPLALFFLVAVIRPLRQLHGKVSMLVWCALAAIAVFCAAVNLGLSIAWLLPGQ
jgi:hypothetical protein